MAALGPRVSRRTAFRKLKDLHARTSYRYAPIAAATTLDELADFDEHGLWAFAGVRFSRAGTLVATAEAFVNDAEAGHFVDELDNRSVSAPRTPIQARRRRAADAAQARRQFLYCATDHAQETHRSGPTAADGHARTRATPARRPT